MELQFLRRELAWLNALLCELSFGDAEYGQYQGEIKN